MIIKQYNSYLGLDQILTAVTDTDRSSPNYLRIDSLPTQLTAGRNALKLYGNTNIFQYNSPILIEVLDNIGNTVYQFMPDYYDSLKRRTVVIQVNEDTAPGPGLITICSVLRDDLVPYEWRGLINFKWQTQINIAPFTSNETEIIYLEPPIIEFNTKVKPFVTASRRNDLEMISYEYGDYNFYDYNFEDHVGDTDSSEAIFQNNKADTLLGSYVDPSITAFDRDNVFYLREENFSAKHVVKNYSIIHPGNSFYTALGTDIIDNGNLETLNYWNTGSIAGTLNAGTAYPGNYYTINTSGYLAQPLYSLKQGVNYLLILSVAGTYDPFQVYLGYDANGNPGSIVENTFKTITPDPGAGWSDKAVIIRSSNAGNNLFISSSTSTEEVGNIRLYEIANLEIPDFTLNSDLIGGYVKIKNPDVFPSIESGYVIDDGDPTYESYIDQIFQKYDAGVDDRFQYNIVSQRDKDNPGESYNVIKQPVNRFASTTILDNQVILSNPQYRYQLDSLVNLFPYVNNCLHPILYNNRFYGTFAYGGRRSPHGSIYEYDPVLKKFKILFNFDGNNGSNPIGRLLPSIDPITGRMVLYGSTVSGGAYNSGSLYSYAPNTNTFRNLYSFGTSGSALTLINRNGGVRGGSPLTLASSGLIYGTTAFGGDYESGVIFQYDPDTSTYSKLYSVPSMYVPVGLVESGEYLWGVAPFAGTNTSGSIFKYGITGSTFTTVHSFNGTDGSRPDGRMMLGSDGVLYGTTITSSAAGVGCVLYKVDPATDTFTLLSNFDELTTGSYGSAELFESDGRIYGVCKLGGTYGSGSVFAYDSASNSVQVIHYFSGSVNDGAQPGSSLVRLGNSIYSATRYGGIGESGTMFRIDLISPSAPFVKMEGGTIFHNNAILPTRIPSYATLIEDYPRWTGPITTGGSDIGVYALVELKMKNLIPLTGDVSKIRIAAKPKGTKSEYIDLGVYSTKPTDVLLDTNYVNHVQYTYSPYRLTGYFKPVITDYNEAPTENPTGKDTLFLNGWNSGSVTNSYFNLIDFHNNLEIVGSPAAGKPVGSIARMRVTSSLAGNGMAYMIYTGSVLPPTSSTLNTWQQISYELFSAYPILTGLEASSSNYYTASSTVDNLGLNNLLVYSALFKNVQPTSVDDILAVSPAVDFHKFNITGSSISQSSGEHPYIFHNKLGWKTDDYLIPNTIAASGSTYMGLIFEYNSSSLNTFGTTIDSSNPHLLEVAGVLSREIGDREHIIENYWEWYSRTKEPLTYLSCSAAVESNTDVLMDSVHLYAIDDEYEGFYQKNRLVLQTKDSYEFIANTPYIVSFNAVSKLNLIDKIGAEDLDPNFSTGLNQGAGSWTGLPASGWASSSGNWISFNFASAFSCSLTSPTGSPNLSGNTYLGISSQYTFGSGTYLVTIETGEFTYSTLNNPTNIEVKWPNGTIYTLTDVQPFNTYSLNIRIPEPTTNLPLFTIKTTYQDPNATVYLLGLSVKPYEVFYDTTTITGTELIQDYGVNQLSGWSLGTYVGDSTYSIGTILSVTEGASTAIGYDRTDFLHIVDNIPSSTSNVSLAYSVTTAQWDDDNAVSVLVLGVNDGSNELLRVNNPTPNTTYTGTVIVPTLDTGQPIRIITQLHDNNPSYVQEITSVRITADPVYATLNRVNPFQPANTSLTVYGVNPSYGVPFRDQITTNDIGEFIGELVHKSQYGIPGETKNFGRVEMEFMAEANGLGKIGFETEAGSNWYLSEISVRPKDRVGLTPGYSRTFIRVPAALVNKPLTLKMEYLNDFNIKSPYVTVLNDIIFTNFEDTQAIPNMVSPPDTTSTTAPVTVSPPGGGGSTVPVTNRYNVTGGSAFANAVDPGDLTDVVTDVATFTSVVVNTPDVSLVAGNKVQFNSTDTYSLTYSFTATSTQTLAGLSAASSGLIRFRHYNSSNVLQATIGTTAFTPPPDTTETLSGTTTINATAGDYVILEIYTTASVTGGTGDEADIEITMDSGYIEITV